MPYKIAKPLPRKPKLADIKRFLSKVKEHGNGCWAYSGHRNKEGYGQFKFANTMQYAHRFSYQAFVKLLQKGETVNHICRNEYCVNPYHLEPMTNGENIADGNRNRVYNYGDEKIKELVLEEAPF
jgi:hypothetical protein